MRIRSAFILSLCLFAFTNPSVRAGNWPSFRGTNGRGIGDGSPPIEWDVESGEKVKWKAAISGQGHSSPIVWGDRIFVTTAVSADKSSPEFKTGWLNGTGDSAADNGPWTWKIMCLNKEDGRLVWQRDAHTGIPRSKRHIKATYANSTPATDGAHVVAFFGSEGLHCYDVDGGLLWKKDLGTLKSGPYNAVDLDWGSANSPIIHDGQVILQCDAMNTAFWASFDVKTGRELRRVKRADITTWSTPSIAESGGRTQVICNGYKEMAGYDLKTGERLWTLHGGGDCPVPTPQVVGNMIYLTNGHGRSPIYAIRADARGDLTPQDDDKLPEGLAWCHPKNGSYMPTPLVLGENLYVASDNGILAAFEAKTGKQLYRERIKGAGEFSASIVAADERLYFVSEAGDMFVFQAGDSFKVLASNSMNEICLATPAIVDGQIFIRGRDHLYCIGN